MVDLLRERCSDIPILFSSHQLDLVERLCDHLVILQTGNVVAGGPVEDLQQRGRVSYRVTCLPDAAWLRDVPGVDVLDVDGATALIRLEPDVTPDLVTAEAAHRGRLTEFARIVPSLAEIFREVTR
jgi:ABC-2 type transport system ATP-binding protein